MTPAQREAALRMIECGEPSNRLTPDELAAWADDAEGLLRELAQEPQAEPVAYLHREEGHADVVILAADWDGPCADCIPLYAHGITEAP